MNILGILLIFTIMAAEPTDTEPEMELIRTTVYDGPSDHTATGRKAEYGIVAYRPDYYGKCCILYTADMEYIGIFECQDTGGTEVKAGRVLDVYCPTRQACYDWVAENGEFCYVQWIDAEG